MTIHTQATPEELAELRRLIDAATPDVRVMFAKLQDLFDGKSNLIVSLALIASIDADAENAEYFDMLRSLVRARYERPGVH
jgi:hypothetical protein